MKYIVVFNPDNDIWQVLDTELDSCSDEKVFYNSTYYMDAVDIVEKCKPVEIEHNATGDVGIGTPLKIQD